MDSVVPKLLPGVVLGNSVARSLLYCFCQRELVYTTANKILYKFNDRLPRKIVSEADWVTDEADRFTRRTWRDSPPRINDGLNRAFECAIHPGNVVRPDFHGMARQDRPLSRQELLSPFSGSKVLSRHINWLFQGTRNKTVLEHFTRNLRQFHFRPPVKLQLQSGPASSAFF